MVSCTSARPAGCSIIAAATSHEAMIPYCGEVEVCIMKASLKRVMSSCLFSPCCTWIIDACDNAASSLCVDCVAKVIAFGERAGLRRRDAVIAVVELVEVGVGVPGLVEMQHVDRVAERLLDGVGVVAEAVIGRVGHHHQADLAAGLLGERAGGDLLLDRLRA